MSQNGPRPHTWVIVTIGAALIVAAGGTIAVVVDAALSSEDEPAPPDTTPTALSTTGGPVNQPTPHTQATETSAPPKLPNLVGTDLSDASAQLRAIGLAEPRLEYVVDEDVPSGQVVEQDPQEGQPAIGRVTLRVARDPYVTYVADMEPTSGFFDIGLVDMDGETYPRSVFREIQISVTPEPQITEYNLSKDFYRFRAVAGLGDDTAVADARFLLRIEGDGQELSKETLRLGSTHMIDVSVVDVLRLRITLQTLDGDVGSSDEVFPALGDAHLLSRSPVGDKED